MRAGLPAEFQMASFFANRAEKFIQENKDNPFVMYVSFLEPHPPWTGPYDGLHDPKQVPIEPTFLKRPDGHSLFSRVRADFFMQSDLHTPDDVDDSEWEKGRDEYNALDKAIGRQFDLNEPDSWKQIRANYYGNITLVDDAVGKILNALDEAEIADNTIFIFTSEHGDLVGTHGMMEMRTFYEEAAKVPLIIRAPMHNKESKLIDGNFGQIDLVPTLLDLLGQDIPEHLQGTSKSDVIKGKTDLEGNEVFMEHNGIGDRNLGTPAINMLNNMQWRSIVTSDRWKLNLCATDQCELFNLNDDPFEENNLFNDPENKDKIRIMAAKIRMWQHETGDNAALPGV
jgi:arylsulfatase A-like enzyme